MAGFCQRSSQGYKFFRGARLTIQDDIFYDFKLFLRNIRVKNFCCWIHDSEVHSCLDGMIEEYGMHGLADIVIATERERQVRDASTDMSSWQVLTYPSCGSYEVCRIGIVLFHARCHSQYIGVKYNI